MRRTAHPAIYLGETSDVPTEDPSFQDAQSEQLRIFLASMLAIADQHDVHYQHRAAYKLESIEIVLTYEGQVSHDFRVALGKRWPALTLEWDTITSREVLHLPCIMYRRSWSCMLSYGLLFLAFFSIMVLCLYIQFLNKPDRYQVTWGTSARAP